MWKYLWRKAGAVGANDARDPSGKGWTVHPDGESESRCDCCQSVSKLVWGKASGGGDWQVDYSIHWTPGVSKKKHPANFDFAVDAPDERGFLVSMILYERDDGGPAIMIIDACRRSFAKARGSRIALSRDDIIGTPMAGRMFAVFDAVWLGDPRVKALA